jgi:hypothetical protein
MNMFVIYRSKSVSAEDSTMTVEGEESTKAVSVIENSVNVLCHIWILSV